MAENPLSSSKYAMSRPFDQSTNPIQHSARPYRGTPYFSSFRPYPSSGQNPDRIPTASTQDQMMPAPKHKNVVRNCKNPIAPYPRYMRPTPGMKLSIPPTVRLRSLFITNA